MSLTIETMSRADLDVALDWAAAEGWNPGLDDADAFLAADPGGFLIGRLDGVPVAAISIVRHSESYSFLGFYLCRPEHRGKGYGMAIWRAGMARLDGLTVGLDGVDAQQENYRRSGFVFAHRTRRYEGIVAGAPRPDFSAARPEDLPELLDFERQIGGVARPAYLSAWFGGAPTRRTLILREGGRITAAGTIRACRSGHKIGPLLAADGATARTLLETLVAEAGADRIALDIPDPNEAGRALAADLGLVSAFACARMYRGPAPERALDRIFGEVTFELG